MTGTLAARFLRKLRPPSGGALPSAAATPLRVLQGHAPGLTIQVEAKSILAQVETLDDAGRFADSLVLLNRALATAPTDSELLLARASTLYAWGRFREARDDFFRAEAGGMTGPKLDVRLGWTSHQLGDPSEADARMRKAVAAQPDNAEAHFGLGAVVQAAGRLDEAAKSYERALEYIPNHLRCLVVLGVCRLDQDDYVGAEAWFRRAIAAHPDSTMAWMHLGIALFRQDRCAEAYEAHERALALESAGGEDVDSFFNYANTLQNTDRTQHAIELFEKNLPQRPHVIGHGQYGMALLAAGRLKEAWHYYEFRWLQQPLVSLRPHLDRPVWSGQDLRGKTILLRAEQGVGDVLQFVRFAATLKSLGATVLLQNRQGMDDLASDFIGVDRVLIPGEPLPAFDYYVHMLSIPRVLDIDLDSIPADVPYLRTHPDRIERWSQRLAGGGGLKVGLVWAGSAEHKRDRYRSIPLRLLRPLCDIEGVRLFSLQKGSGAAQLRALDPAPNIVDLDAELTTFGETAAAIGALDLVISVDTAVAHLTGALGRPLWVLLPHPAEWRWLEKREDCPWYPSARLFRQPEMGNWDEVVVQLAAALRERVDQKQIGMTPEQLAHSPPVRACLEHRTVGRFVPMRVAPGMSAVAEIRSAILQYLPDHDDMGPSLRWYGEWLQPQIELLTRLIRLGQIVMEVGSGVGAHMVALSAAVGRSGHVICYESQPLIKRILRQNIQANRIMNVTVMARTLTGQQTRPSEPPITAITDTVDELQLEHLDWLKINEPTTSLSVLEGSAETLWRLRPRVFVAAADEVALRAIADRAKEFGYRCWRMDTPFFNPRNLYLQEEDIFDGRTRLALLLIPEEIEVDVVLDGCVEISCDPQSV